MQQVDLKTHDALFEVLMNSDINELIKQEVFLLMGSKLAILNRLRLAALTGTVEDCVSLAKSYEAIGGETRFNHAPKPR